MKSLVEGQIGNAVLTLDGGGEVRVPGDKSISHRALILGALAEGETVIGGLSPGADVRSTRSCLGGLGVAISGEGDCARVKGLGLGRLRAPLYVRGRLRAVLLTCYLPEEDDD